MPATPHRARRPTNTRGSVHACSRYDLAHFHAYYQDAVPVFSVESAECIAGAREDAALAPFPTMVVGHVGDGNFHLPMLVDGDNPAEVEAAKILNAQVVRRALQMDGTCTGEHGIGLGKMDFLLAEHGPAASPEARAIKLSVACRLGCSPARGLCTDANICNTPSSAHASAAWQAPGDRNISKISSTSRAPSISC